MKLPEHYMSDMLLFFDGRSSALTAYQALFRHLENLLPDASVRVQKSQIGFYGSHLFAMVSLPRRKSGEGIVVSFGLGHRVNSPRIAAATEPHPNRWTHHVPLSGQQEIDGELLSWLQEAWEFSERKRGDTA